MGVASARKIRVWVDRRRTVIAYAEAGKVVGMPARSLWKLLEDIAWDEYNNERLVLTASVVLKSEGSPSNGFYGITRRQGRLRSSKLSESIDFWAQECKEVCKGRSNSGPVRWRCGGHLP